MNDVSPMAMTLAEQPFSHKDWLFEIKWDGYRCMAFCCEVTSLTAIGNIEPQKSFVNLVDMTKKSMMRFPKIRDVKKRQEKCC